MPLLNLSIAFLAGVILADLLPWPPAAWLLLAALPLLFIFLAPILRAARQMPPAAGRPHRFGFLLARIEGPVARLWPPLPILLGVLLLGSARFAAHQPRFTPEHIYWPAEQGESVTVEGVLVEPPGRRDGHDELILLVERLCRLGDERFGPASGRVLAQVSPGGTWRYGDRLRLTGRLERPPEGEPFSTREWLAGRDIYAWMRWADVRRVGHGEGNPIRAGLFRLQERGRETLYQLFPEPEAGFLAGVLLGAPTGFTGAVKEAFQDTGTAHVIAISGFNMTIVSALFLRLFSRLGRWRGMAAALAGISAYTLLVGAGPAVVRAAIMGGLAVIGRQIGRRGQALNTLAFTAALMTLFEPDLPWDPGFQLSCAAVLGLVLYGEPLSLACEGWLQRRFSHAAAARLAGPLSEYFLCTLAAQVMTLPVLLYHFERLSLISPLANPAILPAQPALMALGGVALGAGLIWTPLGALLAGPAWVFAAYTLRAVELFAAFPAAAVPTGPFPLPLALALQAALAVGPLVWPRFGAGMRAWVAATLRPALVLAGVGVAAVLVWEAALSSPDGRLHLTVLDVGSGDALLIETPTGRRVLVDGGPRPSLLGDALGRRLPSGARRLDWLVVAGTGAEQLAALPPILERFPPGQALWAGTPGATPDSRRVYTALVTGGIPIVPARGGQTLDLGRGAALRVLATSKRGAVLRLEWENFSALLPVGIDFELLDAWQPYTGLAQPDVLLLADSGYAPSNPPELLRALRPQAVVLSVEGGDRDGRPALETLDALAGTTILRTDLNGWIEISTDGEKMWVEVEKR